MQTQIAAATTPLLRAPPWLPSALVLACGTFAMGTDSFVLAGVMPQIASGLHVSVGAAGQSVAAFALTYAVAAPLLAALAGRAPRKPLMGAALVLFALANIGSAASTTLAQLLASRVVAALGAALFTPTASATIVALAGPARRGQALSVILSGLTVGTVFGVPVGTVIGQQWGWRATLLFVVAIAVIALIALAATLPRVAAGHALSLSERLSAFSEPRILVVAAVNLASTAGGFMVYTYVSQILGVTARLSGPALAVVLLAWGLGSSVGALGSGWTADRIGPNRTLIGAIICLGFSLFLLGIADGMSAIVALMAVFGAAGWSVNTPVNHRLTAIAPAHSAVAISLNASGAYLGQALGALIGGLLLASGVAAPELCLAGAALSGVALLVQLLSMRIAG